ncbi:hypothetical protein ABT224_28170 [Streptomyces sp. NPDC001584]|uniref:hypothetical protein n=1 Tax=Streptomyces sp. NPDC001584 TaxID=3154521 RepID=UPI0033188811
MLLLYHPEGKAERVDLCACLEPQLTALISGQEHLAEPCEQMTPAATVYTASCRTCGGPYDKPWRRIRP